MRETFQHTHTLINKANLAKITKKLWYYKGKIQAYKDMLYHLRDRDTADALAKCQESMELMRHNRQLLQQNRRQLLQQNRKTRFQEEA